MCGEVSGSHVCGEVSGSHAWGEGRGWGLLPMAFYQWRFGARRNKYACTALFYGDCVDLLNSVC